MRYRTINFKLKKELDFVFNYGTYVLILYYSKLLNPEMTEKLFDVTNDEHEYKFNHNLPSESNLIDEDLAHFDLTAMQEVIKYIDDTLIPALSQESGSLIERYGGLENFISLVDAETGTSCFRLINIFENDFYCKDSRDLCVCLHKIKDILFYSISINQPFRVWVW